MNSDQLTLTFSALADPTRRSILARLAQGEATVNELAAPFAISLQAVSKHLKVLERAGLIARGKDRQLRPSKIQGAALREAAAFLEDYREFWDDSFDRLGEHLHGGPAVKHEIDDHARLRRAAPARLGRVDRAGAARGLVGQARLDGAAGLDRARRPARRHASA